MEVMITETQARRMIEWAIAHGHSEAEAYEQLAYVMNADVKDKKSGEKDGKNEDSKSSGA